jgi:hypothetical protein
MKYLLTIHMNHDVFDLLSEEERNAVMAGHEAFMAELRETGEMAGTIALAAPSNTRTVRVRDGAQTVTDGPYIEAKEYLAGFYVVDCDTPERAAALAARIPDARFSAIEVRPVMFDGGVEM